MEKVLDLYHYFQMISDSNYTDIGLHVRHETKMKSVL